MFRFAHEEYLWLLLLLPFLLAIAFYYRWQRRKGLKKLASCPAARARLLPKESIWRFWCKHAFFLIALLFFILALARPQFGIKEDSVKRSGSEIMLVLDVSRSMLAQDVKPNRLERAKLEVLKLTQRLQKDRIGLVLFAGDAFVQLPITNDYLAAQMFIDQVSVDMISNQGTALRSALLLAHRSFSPMENVGRAIIVISDGEDHEEDPLPVAKELAQEGIVVFTVGVGSPQGAPIPDGYTNNYKTDSKGNIVISKLDERILSQVALTTGGFYMRIGGGVGALDRIINKIEHLEKAEFDVQVFTSYDEQYQLFLAIGLFFFLLSVLLYPRKHPWFNVEGLYTTLTKRSASSN